MSGDSLASNSDSEDSRPLGRLAEESLPLQQLAARRTPFAAAAAQHATPDAAQGTLVNDRCDLQICTRVRAGIGMTGALLKAAAMYVHGYRCAGTFGALSTATAISVHKFMCFVSSESWPCLQQAQQSAWLSHNLLILRGSDGSNSDLAVTVLSTFSQQRSRCCA